MKDMEIVNGVLLTKITCSKNSSQNAEAKGLQAVSNLVDCL